MSLVLHDVKDPCFSKRFSLSDSVGDTIRGWQLLFTGENMVYFHKEASCLDRQGSRRGKSNGVCSCAGHDLSKSTDCGALCTPADNTP